MKKKQKVARVKRPSPQPAAGADSLRTMAQSPSAPFQLKPEEVERALITGEHASMLQRYFGEAQYAELQAIARSANARVVRGGPRVFVLPGIMGSTIGSERPLFLDDVVWIDPIDIATGNLTSLALIPRPGRHKALGVLLFVYLKLKLSLRLSGFDADFHQYDWRQSIDKLGLELARRITADKASEVYLVAHSMGGLVSRAALKNSGSKVKRLVMLGTPNYGSFAPVQALRAVYPVIRKIALVDLKHSPEYLTENIFNTFPSLYQMLPAREKFGGLDIFDPGKWPSHGVRPRPALLKAAADAQAFLAEPDKRFMLIAGVNQETVTDLSIDVGSSEFLYHVTSEGDGTVPLGLAQLPGVATYFIDESHGSLPNNSTVIRAVKDLLNLGETSVLPTTWTKSRALPARTITDEDVRASVPDAGEAPKGAAVSDRDIRHLVEELAAPEMPAVTPVAAAAAVDSISGVVVGRRLQRTLDVHLALGDITEAVSKAYVCGIFRDVTPTGAVRAIDAELDGAIAEFSQRRMFSGNVGEVFVIPAVSSRLRADTVLLAGLGAFDRFTEDTLEVVAENVIRTLVRTGVDEFAAVLVGSASGRGVAGSLRHMLTGFVRGLLDADKRRNFRRVTVCEMDRERYAEMRSELYRLASTDLFEDIQVSFEEETLPEPRKERAIPHGLAPVGPAPVYLLVRQEDIVGGNLEFQSSVLTAGAKATVVSGRSRMARGAMNRLMAAIESEQFQDEIDDFGRGLARSVVNPDVAIVLKKMEGRPLVVVHDAPASRIPWETIRLDGWVPALNGGISRRYLAENLSVAKWLESRKERPVLKILLVVNPTSDLPGAEEEGRRIQNLFAQQTGIHITRRHRSEASKTTLLKDFSSGLYDVIHYAGHAYFDKSTPSKSGILCSGRQVVSGAELAGIGNLPNLIFFNACESGRVRAAKPGAAPKAIHRDLEKSIGLAEAFLRGGAANYVGTYWPVGDAPAKAFAETFYHGMLKGNCIGDALMAGRQKVFDLGSVDWADYIFYGSPEFILKRQSQL